MSPQSDSTETSTDTSHWWRRDAGGAEVLSVALPLVISSLSWTVMTFVDRMFLKWVSGSAMAAAFSAGTFWFAVLCLPLGICMYCATFVSQYFGNKQPERIGPSVWQGVWVSLFTSPIVMLAIPLAPSLFAMARHTPEMTTFEIQYFQILCIGIPPMLIAQALSTFYAGRGKTKVIMCVDTSVTLLNLVLDYVWIFGHAGFPKSGIQGAAWATVTALFVKAIVYLVLLLRRGHREEFATAKFAPDSKLLKRLLFFGAPSGFQLVLEVLGFSVFVLLVGRLGALEAEATSMAFSISTLGFMPIWGFAQAASILVGQKIGEKRVDLAARSTWTALTLAMSYMTVISMLYVGIPQVFLYGFFAGGIAPGSHNEDVYILSISLLRFVAAYNLFDAALMVFVSAIKGAGDTRFVMAVSFIMAILLAAFTWLSVEAWHLGVFGCWYLITAWIWIQGTIYLLRFMQGKWKKMKVIEFAH